MQTDEVVVVPTDVSHSRDQSAPEKVEAIEVQSALGGIPKGEIGQYPLTAAVKAISELGIKGQSAMVLLFASTRILETDLAQGRSENQQLSEEIKSIQNNYYEVKEQLAVVNERLGSTRKIRTLQNVLLTLGGLGLGTGVRMMTQDLTGTSLVFAILGAILLLFGWLWPSEKSKEGKS